MWSISFVLHIVYLQATNACSNMIGQTRTWKLSASNSHPSPSDSTYSHAEINTWAKLFLWNILAVAFGIFQLWMRTWVCFQLWNWWKSQQQKVRGYERKDYLCVYRSTRSPLETLKWASGFLFVTDSCRCYKLLTSDWMCWKTDNWWSSYILPKRSRDLKLND